MLHHSRCTGAFTIELQSGLYLHSQVSSVLGLVVLLSNDHNLCDTWRTELQAELALDRAKKFFKDKNLAIYTEKSLDMYKFDLAIPYLPAKPF